MHVHSTSDGRKAPNGAGSVFYSPRRNAWLASYTRGLDNLGRPIVKRFQASTEWEARSRRDADRARLEAMRLLGVSADVPVPPVPRDLPNGREFVRLNDPVFRRWIYQRDLGLCSICGDGVAFGEMHVDHIRPRIDGGNDHVSNLRISHAYCNHERGYRRGRPISTR